MARKAAGRKAGRGSSPRQRAARKAARQSGADEERSDYRNKVRAQKVQAANKQQGCASKLFMLLLPFAAIGAYLVLRS